MISSASIWLASPVVIASFTSVQFVVAVARLHPRQAIVPIEACLGGMVVWLQPQHLRKKKSGLRPALPMLN